MKKHYKILSLVVLVSSTLMQARQFTTPLTVWRGRGYQHYPLRPTDPDSCWSLDIWGAGLHRETPNGYPDTDTTSTVPLSNILFGADAFSFIQTLPPGTVIPDNPFLSFLEFNPAFSYSENDALFGFVLERSWGCCDEWYGGLRCILPVREVKTELTNCCDLVEDISDVAVSRQRELVLDEDGVPQVVEDAFAYRLDFLASLPMTVNGPATDRLVKFTDPLADGNITINNIQVTGAPLDPLNDYPVTVIATDGGTPPPPFSLVQSAVNPAQPSVEDLPCLSNDGTLATGSRARFCESPLNNYAALAGNVAAQRRLWVVPSVATQGVAPNEVFGLVPSARSIQTATQSLLEGFTDTTLAFLAANGISFASQTNLGLGDLDAEFYVGRSGCDWFAEGTLGFKFPTGKRITTPGQLLLMPTGNNGHVEIRIGGLGGWNPCDWIAIQADAFYSWALKRSEMVAAPFSNATVRNIGPAISGDVSWGYFVADLDATFLVPTWPAVGVDIGYRAYVKQHDHISFDVTSATDFFGVSQTLDASVLENRTNVVAHQVKTEVFHQGCDWQIFAGWSNIFAGKNATRDTDWYLGFVVYF